MDTVSLAGSSGPTRSTVFGAAPALEEAVPSNQHQNDGINGSSSSSAQSPRADYDGPRSVPSLKPHNDWPSSIPALASISQFIHPETRGDPTKTGYYALSSPQLYALRKWKAVHTYAVIFENQANLAQMERNGLHYEYAVDKGVGKLYNSAEERKSRGVMEIGGLIVEVKGEEVKGRKLSEVLAAVDKRVEREWVEQGWVDEGPPVVAERRRRQSEGAGKGRKRVRLTLKMGGRKKKGEGSGDEADREGEMEEGGSGNEAEGEGEGESERTEEGRKRKGVKLMLRMGGGKKKEGASGGGADEEGGMEEEGSAGEADEEWEGESEVMEEREVRKVKLTLKMGPR